jgi:uncharacterized protein with HEPN domain
MSKPQQRLIDYLSHIQEAIERIEHYVEDSSEIDFLNSSLLQDAVIRNFEVLGEASHNIEVNFSSFVIAHPELPLSDAYQMRNALSHGYFKVDLELVWRTIHKDLPELHRTVVALKTANATNQ